MHFLVLDDARTATGGKTEPVGVITLDTTPDPSAQLQQEVNLKLVTPDGTTQNELDPNIQQDTTMVNTARDCLTTANA